MAYKSYIHERYEEYMNMMELTSIINDLKLAYEETGNEHVLRSLRRLEAKQKIAREIEVELCEQDFEEILNHPELYPHAVRTWAFKYRNSEIS
jgi:uncharacterized membrane protein (DUF106 family)